MLSRAFELLSLLSLSLLLSSLLALFAGCKSPQPPATQSATPIAGTTTRELVIYRPGNSMFYLQHDGTDSPYRSLSFGALGDIPLWAAFTGDGKNVPGVYRNGKWLISSHADGIADMEIDFGGEPGDVPLAGDVDGDGKADPVVFRSGTWIVRGTRSPAQPFELHFGTAGDIPLLADFDGDGKIDLAVYRNGDWFVDTDRDGDGDLTFSFGGERNDRPLAFDWNGNGKAVPVLFRDGNWFIDGNRDGNATQTVAFGAAGDVPLAIVTNGK